MQQRPERRNFNTIVTSHRWGRRPFRGEPRWSTQTTNCLPVLRLKRKKDTLRDKAGPRAYDNCPGNVTKPIYLSKKNPRSRPQLQFRVQWLFCDEETKARVFLIFWLFSWDKSQHREGSCLQHSPTLTSHWAKMGQFLQFFSLVPFVKSSFLKWILEPYVNHI